MRTVLLITSLILAATLLADDSTAENWTRFRGPDGTGKAESKDVPIRWSETKNLRWKVPLPGKGSSSPIVFGNRVFVTCYSGYGERNEGGDITALTRHLICIDRGTGKIAWLKEIPAVQPEDSYRGFITEHGYASNTPVTDGKHVYAFFGKSGVFAFDFDGTQVWKTDVGKESSNRRWGSAASLILYQDKVIVNASEESQSIRALNTSDGKEVWKAEASLLELAYGTPALIGSKEGDTWLAIGVPGEVWGLNPASGKLSWYAETDQGGNITPSLIVSGDTVYSFGGRPGAAHAIRLAGKGDLTDSTIWSIRDSSYVATPLLHEGHLYWIDDRGQAFCLAAKTGKVVYRTRVEGLSGSGGRPVYASPVLVGKNLIVPSRWNGVFVIPATPEFKVVARNQFESDKSDFNATPAISNDEMFLRSDRFLYCVSATPSAE